MYENEMLPPHYTQYNTITVCYCINVCYMYFDSGSNKLYTKYNVVLDYHISGNFCDK